MLILFIFHFQKKKSIFIQIEDLDINNIHV